MPTKDPLGRPAVKGGIDKAEFRLGISCFASLVLDFLFLEALLDHLGQDTPSQLLFLLPTALGMVLPAVQRVEDVLMRVGDDFRRPVPLHDEKE